MYGGILFSKGLGFPGYAEGLIPFKKCLLCSNNIIYNIEKLNVYWHSKGCSVN